MRRRDKLIHEQEIEQNDKQRIYLYHFFSPACIISTHALCLSYGTKTTSIEAFNAIRDSLY